MWTHSETNDHFYKTLSMRYTGQPMTDFKSLVNSTKCLHSYLFLYESPPHSSSHLIPSVSAAIYHQFLLHLYIPYLYCLLTRITIIDSQSTHQSFLIHHPFVYYLITPTFNVFKGMGIPQSQICHYRIYLHTAHL